MTCIVGLREKGNVFIGGDSAGIAGWDVTVRADPKVFVNGDYLIGCAGSFRMAQLLNYSLRPPKPPKPDALMRFMTTKFIDSVRKCLKDGGFAEQKDNVEQIDGLFLVGVKGRLFIIDADYQVGEPIQPFAAIGCGEPYAVGAMYATQKSDSSPGFRIEQALRAATEFSAGVRPPYTVLYI